MAADTLRNTALLQLGLSGLTLGSRSTRASTLRNFSCRRLAAINRALSTTTNFDPLEDDFTTILQKYKNSKSKARYSGSWVLAIVMDEGFLTNNDLCSIARTNMKFKEKAERMIWHSIHIKNDSAVARERATGLFCTLDEGPAGVAHIRHLDIDWGIGKDHTLFMVCLNTLLGETAQLKTLKLRFFSFDISNLEEMHTIDASFLEDKPMQYLEGLHLSNILLPPSGILEFMLLPKMKAISVSHVDNSLFLGWNSLLTTPPPPPTTSQAPGTEVSPTRGKARMCLHVDGHVKELTYSLVEATPDTDGKPPLSKGTVEGIDLQDNTRVQQIPEELPLHLILSPWYKTLKGLQLSGYTTGAFHLKTINLSIFESLTTLITTHAFLFRTVMHGNASSGLLPMELRPRDGLVERLPKSLEHLEIFFDAGSSILDWEYNPINHPYTKEDLKWIEELTSHPNLKHVDIEEHYCCSSITVPQNRGGIKPWKIPEKLQLKFNEQKIILNVRVRKLHGFVTPNEYNIVIPDKRYFNLFSPWNRYLYVFDPSMNLEPGWIKVIEEQKKLVLPKH